MHSAKQLTLFECPSHRRSASDGAKRRRTDSPQNEEDGRSKIQTLQKNTIIVDCSTGSTTITVNDSCSPIVSLGGNGDLRHDRTQHADMEDTGNGHSEPSTSHMADDVPTDIAGGPGEAPVQPKMKFPTTASRFSKGKSVNTHKGVFEYSRMLFDITSAPAIFQRTIDNFLQGLDHVTVYIDDIITGRTKEKHFHTQDEVLTHLENTGV